MSDDAHPGWAVYDLDRLRANLAEIRRRIVLLSLHLRGAPARSRE